jgi:hypothetical protein
LESFFKPSIAKIEQLLKEQITKGNYDMESGKKISVSRGHNIMQSVVTKIAI